MADVEDGAEVPATVEVQGKGKRVRFSVDPTIRDFVLYFTLKRFMLEFYQKKKSQQSTIGNSAIANNR